MGQLQRAGQTGALDVAANAGVFQEQIAAVADMLRQLGGNARVVAGSLAQADPLTSPFTLYVNPYIGSDRFVGGAYNSFEEGATDEEIIASKLKRIELQRLECGYTSSRPFKTINRAVIEAAIITSKNWYTYTDPRAHVDCVSIVLAPAVHVLHNDPGSSSTSLPSWGTAKDPTIAELIAFNPANVGGVLLPRGVSLCGPDLRKTTIRPTWVPAAANEAADYSNRRGMLKITGTGYFFGFTVMDKVGENRSHHLLDAFHFASKAELDPFYAKCFSAVGAGADLGAALTVTRSTEFEIVGPIDIADSPKPEWDTTASASPYIFNCSIRSDYGLGGAFMDGAKVKGLKSMVCANFTGVSLQKDMSSWQRYVNGNWTSTTYAQYIATDPDSIRMNPARLSRHISAINNAFIQEVSVFAIGQGVHHFTDTGGEITVTNSNSSFGGCAAISRGYNTIAFPQDRNWTVGRLRVPVNLGEKVGNIRRIFLGTIDAITSTRITLASPLAIDETSSTIPALLLRDGYSLPANTKVWVENPTGDDWRADLTAAAWSASNADRINIQAALSQSGTNDPVGTNPDTGASLAIGKRVYIRRLVDTRSPNERRVSLQLNNTSSARIPERNFILQTDPDRSGGAISRVLAPGGAEVFAVSGTGVGPAAGAGVAKTAEVTIRRSAGSVNYANSTFFRAGTIVKYAGKHYQSLRDQTTASAVPDPLTWGETFVHMPSDYNAEDVLRNESPILTIDTDTDANADTQTCGINFTTVWTSAGPVRDQYRSATDYVGVHAFLVALGLTATQAHTVLLPRSAATRTLDPSNATDLPDAPSGGAANGRGNWAVEFRRPSVLRLYGHAWEWAGFLNYSKSIPAAQKDLSPQNKFTYYFTNDIGGRVVPQGSNEDGFNVSPKGLEDIETGATLTVDSIGSSTLDDFQSTDFPNGLTASEITVDNLLINESVTFPQTSVAKTGFLGPVQLATIEDIDTQTNAATSNAQLDQSGVRAVTLPGLERWRQQRNLLSGAQPGATLVVLHVASSPATALTGDASVPFGYATAGHAYNGPLAPGLRGTLFSSVTAALDAASRIYVPVGSEIIISVHDSLSAVEAGPLTIGNGITPWVLAGARGATSPKVKLAVGTTAVGTTRLPQVPVNAYIVGGIIADLEVEFDCGAQGLTAFLTLDGGFGVGQRDTILRWKNIGASATLNNATCSYGGKVQTRVYHGITSGDKAIRTILEKSSEVAAPVLIMFGQSGGLLGHGSDIVYDFSRSDYGNGASSTLVFKFEHDYNTTVPLSFYSLGGRGGCRTGTRSGPFVSWDFSGDNWNLGSFVNSNWRNNQNYNGVSFKTKAVVSNISASYGITATTAATFALTELGRGASLDMSTESTKNGGAYSLLLAVEGQSYSGGVVPSVLVTAKNREGSYIYGGASNRNITS
jgi:hypothetical protein